MDPATIRYANASHAPRETARTRKPRNSPSSAAGQQEHTPPASIWAPELMALAAGSGILRVRDAATDQLMAATIKAQAPAVSTGASPRLIVCPTRTATPREPDEKSKPESQREALGSQEKNFRHGHEHRDRRQHHGGDARRHTTLRPEQQARSREQKSGSPARTPRPTRGRSETVCP